MYQEILFKSIGPDPQDGKRYMIANILGNRLDIYWSSPDPQAFKLYITRNIIQHRLSLKLLV